MKCSTLTRSQDNERDCVELGLSCANICQTFERRMSGKELEDLNKPVRDVISQLTR